LSFPVLSLTRSQAVKALRSAGGALSVGAAAILTSRLRNGAVALYDLFPAAIRRAYTRGGGFRGGCIAAAQLKRDATPCAARYSIQRSYGGAEKLIAGRIACKPAVVSLSSSRVDQRGAP